jgi:hypothetical protein
MRVLTLTQPWATLVAIGAKQIETRSWPTHYRGPLLIHAAAGLGPGGRRAFYDLCYSEAFTSVLAPLWSPGTFFAPVSLPFGAIVARCELTGLAQMCGEGYIRTLDTRVIFKPSRQELAFGDYTPGRYAWLLSDVQALPTPIPVKGQLGLWEYDL